ncbi:hypothetical protein B0H16DRAFT_1457678 [Mycena metata]|uniref:Uncharacterized protein n=1 Tax=Mycena metata TaxID=1033252 RepID=A0AAD7J5B6_9AGAR|nr:hypothetical protein B0H16DRAFT_1457678 [Mycena metata]
MKNFDEAVELARHRREEVRGQVPGASKVASEQNKIGLYACGSCIAGPERSGKDNIREVLTEVQTGSANFDRKTSTTPVTTGGNCTGRLGVGMKSDYRPLLELFGNRSSTLNKI